MLTQKISDLKQGSLTRERERLLQALINEKKKLITTGKVSLFFIDIKTGKWIGMPEDLKKTLAVFFK